MEDYSIMVKVGTHEYYMGDVGGKNKAMRHIDRLLTQPTLRVGDVEDEDDGVDQE